MNMAFHISQPQTAIFRFTYLQNTLLIYLTLKALSLCLYFYRVRQHVKGLFTYSLPQEQLVCPMYSFVIYNNY